MKVITANAFASGEAIYLGNQGWVDDLQLAQIYTDDQDVETVISDASKTADKVIGVYAIAVEQKGDQIIARQYREAIRALGPTNYRHGKAVEGVAGYVSL